MGQPSFLPGLNFPLLRASSTCPSLFEGRYIKQCEARPSSFGICCVKESAGKVQALTMKGQGCTACIRFHVLKPLSFRLGDQNNVAEFPDASCRNARDGNARLLFHLADRRLHGFASDAPGASAVDCEYCLLIWRISQALQVRVQDKGDKSPDIRDP